MDKNRIKKRFKKPRVTLTERDLKLLFEINGTRSPATLAKRCGLPYLLVYNVINRRVASVSNRHYKMLFGRPAPRLESLKVDGILFRAMVDLWQYLNDGQTKADLYRDILKVETDAKIDHRIFSGKINSIDVKLEHAMRQKFSDAGVDDQLLEQWLDEFEALKHSERVPYARVKPVLFYLEEKLGLHPTSVLNQSVTRYESGLLNTVPRRVADQAEALKRKTEKALQEQGEVGLNEIRASFSKVKTGYRPYTDVKEELLFLRKYARKSIKGYLGRGLWTYEKGKAVRITNWRARKILHDCDRFIRKTPTLTLASLPLSHRRAQIRALKNVLLARSTQLLSKKEGIDFEKRVLQPSYAKDVYDSEQHGFTPFDMAPSVLGMRRKAFDIMVAKNCEIFRSVGKFTQRWYLPDLYLKELSKKKDFGLISAKYELMAKNMRRSHHADACLQ